MPASPAARRPVGVNVNANGTGVADAFRTGVPDRRPFGPTANTSMLLPLPLVVTINWPPLGVNPTWPGELTEERRIGVVQPERSCRIMDRAKHGVVQAIALHGPGAT